MLSETRTEHEGLLLIARGQNGKKNFREKWRKYYKKKHENKIKIYFRFLILNYYF